MISSITRFIKKSLARFDAYQIASVPVLIFILLCSVDFNSSDIVIGAVLPLSGRDAARGLSSKRGIELALDHINKDGGINSKKLRVAFIDSQSSGQKTTEAAVELIYEKKVMAILGGFEQADAFLLQQLCEQSKTAFISPVCTHFALTRNNSEYTFRSVSDDILQFDSLAEMSYRRLNARKPAIIYDNELYGADSAAKYSESAAKNGQRVCIAVSCQNETVNFKKQLDVIMAVCPDSLVILTRPEEAGMILRQFREAGFKLPVIGGSPLSSKEFLNLAGVYSESVLTVLPYNPRAGGMKADNFLADFYDSFGVQADAEAAHSYEALNIIAGAIRNSNGSKSSLKTLLSQAHGWENVAGSGGFNVEQNQVRPVELAVIKNLQVIPVSLEGLF